MQLEPRDLFVLIRDEAERLAHLAANGRKDDLEGLKKAVAKLILLLEALEAVSTKR
jgi:hypothetical protein